VRASFKTHPLLPVAQRAKRDVIARGELLLRQPQPDAQRAGFRQRGQPTTPFTLWRPARPPRKTRIGTNARQACGILKIYTCHSCTQAMQPQHTDHWCSLNGEATFTTVIGPRPVDLPACKQSVSVEDVAGVSMVLCLENHSKEVSMSADIKIAQRTGSIFEVKGWRQQLRRAFIAFCSCFVLVALCAAAFNIEGAVLKLGISLNGEATFTTVIGPRPVDLPACKQSVSVEDVAGVSMVLCLARPGLA
jgi:hypothetical protein